MFCRSHDREIDHKDLLEHVFEHQLNLEEYIMGNTAPLTDAVGKLIAENQALKAENATLKAAGDDDQATLDSLTSEINAELTPAPTTTPAARTLYTFTGADPSTIDATQWTAAGLAADGVTQLYTFAGDLNAGDATGVSADWAVYTAPAAAPAA